MNIKERLVSLLSKKFILSVIVLVAGVVFLMTGEIDYDQFLNLAKWTLGIYVAGNAATHGVYAIPGIVNK